MMAASSPAVMAAVVKVALSSGLCGRPKDTLLTPRTVFTPSLFFTSEIAFTVSRTSACCAEAVSVRQSIRMSSFGMPYSCAVFTIFSAIRSRSSALEGMPVSSSVSPMTTAPYFATMGSTSAILLAFPLTELMMGLPFTYLAAASIAFVLALSI